MPTKNQLLNDAFALQSMLIKAVKINQEVYNLIEEFTLFDPDPRSLFYQILLSIKVAGYHTLMMKDSFEHAMEKLYLEDK